MTKFTSLSIIITFLLYGMAAVAANPESTQVPAGPVAEVSEDAIDDANQVIDTGTSEVEANPAGAVVAIVEAFRDGRWGAAIGMLVVFLIWGLRKFFWSTIPKNILPWLVLALGSAITVSTEILSGIVWWKALIDGFVTSACAIALWSLVFKHVLPHEKKEADKQ